MSIKSLKDVKDPMYNTQLTLDSLIFDETGAVEYIGDDDWYLTDFGDDFVSTSYMRHTEFPIEINISVGMLEEGNGWAAVICGEGFDAPEVITGELTFNEDGILCGEDIGVELNKYITEMRFLDVKKILKPTLR